MSNHLLTPEELKPDRAWHTRWVALHPEYEERPVGIKKFINSPEYLNGSSDCWEPIKEDLDGLFQVTDEAKMEWQYNEAVFDEGIGGGKSYKASLIITYLVYRALLLREPQKLLSLARGSAIYFINMSIRGDQAKKVVFGEIKQRIENANWFRSHGYLPDPNVRSELRFPKNICVVPGNSKETFPLGYNLLGGVMDEAAWYTETETHDVAEEMFNALHNRIKNRFGNKGMLVMISSPRYVDDFIEKKMAEAKTNNRIYTVRKTSWDSKPKWLFSGKTIVIENTAIPKEYEIEAIRNWERFKRDYMAIPSLALEPYFRRWELVMAGEDKTLKDPVIPETTIFIGEFRGNPSYSYYMHIDLSLTTDATGIAMCHRQGDGIVVDLMMRIKAPKGGEIDLAEVRNIVIELRARGFSIKKCTYDQFQSASSIQELNKMGIESEQLSMDKTLAPYETLKEGIYTGKVKYYHFQSFLDEMMRLELVKGKKVDHPANSSKDICDAVAGAVYNCVLDNNDFAYWFAGTTNKQTPEEKLQEDALVPVDGLVPYGYFRGRRSY
ncbi:MAG: hypothetical protein WC208_08380 [Gallionella sp.]|jgi:hypothetical protein